MLGKRFARVVILAIVLMFVLSSNTYFHRSADTDFETPTHDPGIEEKPKDVAEGTKGTPIDIISREFSIPAGDQYYVYYDNATDTLRAMKLPDLRAGLPDIALQAIDTSPNWLKPNLTRKFGYLSEEDIDVGSRGNPAFADIDKDGDYDLIVGESTGGLLYLENVDDGYHYYEGYDYFINAVYVQNDSMFSGIDVGDYSDPTFADLDNDMDVDIIVGNSTGKLQYFENITTGWAAPVTLGISVLGYGTPCLVDFDGDLDFDLFIGGDDGKVNYSENVGTPFVPSWAALTNIYLDGNVSNVTDVGSYSNPAAGDFFDDDGDVDLVVGERFGRLYYYSYDASTGNWTDVTSMPYLYSTSIDVLDYSSPALLDLDSNLVLDMVIGSSMGYVHYRENMGTAAEPRWLVWSNPTTGFSWVNINDYYEDDYVVKLRYRGLTSWLENYSQMIIDVSSSPDTIKQLDELVFTIAHTSTASLALAPLGPGSPLVFPEVYRNNTETLYYNDQFIDYANILDFNVGTPEQWSTVEYWVNESGKINRYLHPKEIYYWFIVHPRLSDEVVTFIDPTVATWGHWMNAAKPPPTGKFWRWSVFNEASSNWPPDPGSVKYPKEHMPPIMKDHLLGVTTMWNMMRYNAPGIYDNDGFETGNRPWDYQDHAIEKVSQWVERTLPLNAQEHNDGNRPHQPVRIQWEHNGNCGELGDLTAAALRSALIPAIEHVAYPEDHCWNHFYERWWHGMDNYWSAGGSQIDDNDRHLTWNRDWSAIMSTRGDTLAFDTSPWDHKIYDANGDGYQDRGNVTVFVRDMNDNPVDGVKIAVADWSDWGGYIPVGSQWTYTNAEGKAYFHTSESRQDDNMFNNGLLIHIGSKLGGGQLNPGYGSRFIICIEDPIHSNPANLPMYVYISDDYLELTTPMPRPHPPAMETSYPGGGQYLLRAGFKTLYGVQHPPNGLGLDDRRTSGGSKMFDKTYHDYTFTTGNHLDAFIVNTSNLQKFLKGDAFEANSTLYNETSGMVSFDIPLNEDWYFVLSNQDTIETTKVVNLTVELFDFPTFTPDNSVQPPTNLTIALSGDNLENVTLSWDLSLDDPGVGVGENDIVEYEIFYSRKYNGSKEGYMLLASVPNGTSSYIHAYAGNGYIGSEWEGKDYPPDNFFYFVVARDDDWNSANTTEQVAKFIRRLAVGMNLASFPLVPIDPSTEMVLQTVAFDKVWHYNASDPDHWKTYMTFKPYKGDLLELDNKMGFWVNATEFSFLTVVGYPAQPTQIQLKAGWNLISYPSYTWSTVAAVLSTVTYERVEGFYLNAEPERTRLYIDSDFMAPGYAYWVKASADSVLVIFY